MFLASLVIAATLQGTCAPSDGLEAICGPVASEDLARIPGTSWLIASGLNVGAPAHLYLVDVHTRRSRTLFPRGTPRMTVDASLRGICPAPPQLDAMSLDGLNVRRASRGKPLTLLAANHGDRHAIEIFAIDSASHEPALRWIGCVPMPKGTLANAVVPLADGGMIVTSFRNPDDPYSWARMETAGGGAGVWEWHEARGWRPLPVGDVPGANGVEISADERTLYVSSWASRRLVVLDRDMLARRDIELDFLPDNVHRAADGSLLVAGQRATVAAIAACGASCPQQWTVVRVEPASGLITPLLSGKGSAAINYACGALEVDGTLFVTLRGAALIASKRLNASR